MEFQEGICKVCLERRGHCRFMDGNTTNLLSMLLPKTDFAVIQGPVICRNCADMLTRCYGFKAMCLRTYKSIVRLVNKKSVKLKLRHVYLSRNATGTGVPEDQDICGFCVGLIKNVPAASLLMLEKMTKQCLPELNSSIIENLVICAPCLGSLENCFRFLTNCLISEEKIKKYRDALDVHFKGEIELSRILQFRKTHSTNQVDGILLNRIKVEQQFCDDKSLDEREIDNRGGMIELEKTFVDDDFELAIEDVKIKSEIFLEMDHGEGDHQFTSKDMLKLEGKSDVPDFIKTEELLCVESKAKLEGAFAETEDQTFSLNEEFEIKTEDNNFNRFTDSTVLSQPDTATILPIKQQCLTYSDLETDKLTPYIEKTLANHLQRHNDPLEVTVYRCDSCSYQTKHKRHLKSHSLKHKDPSEATMYQCGLCLYQTKYKQSLNRHMLKHKDPSEVTVYKCEHCSFQTKRKHGLKKHLLSHKDPSQVTMHKCGFCSYQTKYKGNLPKHLLKHSSDVTTEDASEVTTYKCDSCLYQTVYKYYLKQHLLKHKDASEVTMYRCDTCLYQTKYIGDLKRHLLNHEDLSSLPIYKCDTCSFQTKHKHMLKNHFLKHKNPSEVTMYKCDHCSYQSKYKSSLKKHFLTYKNSCK